jgi:hypothetical protein
MQNAKCKVQSAKCEMRNAKCEMRNAKCEMQLHNVFGQSILIARTNDNKETIRQNQGKPTSASHTTPHTIYNLQFAICTLHFAFYNLHFPFKRESRPCSSERGYEAINAPSCFPLRSGVLRLHKAFSWPCESILGGLARRRRGRFESDGRCSRGLLDRGE